MPSICAVYIHWSTQDTKMNKTQGKKQQTVFIHCET